MNVRDTKMLRDKNRFWNEWHIGVIPYKDIQWQGSLWWGEDGANTFAIPPTYLMVFGQF